MYRIVYLAAVAALTLVIAEAYQFVAHAFTQVSTVLGG